jgi:NAD(P)-dependent dehydrogenase (short-subunit alcohol dehydrogenase family)
MTDPAAPLPAQPADPVGGITDAPPRAVPPVALVTGAARGVGAATVAALAAGGWRVIAADLCADDPALPYSLGRRADLDRVAGAAGDGVVAWVADARDPRELAAAVGEAERRWGGLDASSRVASRPGSSRPSRRRPCSTSTSAGC